MTRTSKSPLFNIFETARNLGRAADAVARAAESTARARAEGMCLVCGDNPALAGADYCGECRDNGVEMGAAAAKSGIDALKDALLGRR